MHAKTLVYGMHRPEGPVLRVSNPYTKVFFRIKTKICQFTIDLTKYNAKIKFDGAHGKCPWTVANRRGGEPPNGSQTMSSRHIAITAAIRSADPAIVAQWHLSKAERQFAKWHFWRNGVFFKHDRAKIMHAYSVMSSYNENDYDFIEDGVVAAKAADNYQEACNYIGSLGSANHTEFLGWSLEGTSDAEILDYIEEGIFQLETERYVHRRYGY